MSDESSPPVDQDGADYLRTVVVHVTPEAARLLERWRRWPEPDRDRTYRGCQSALHGALLEELSK